MKKVLLFCTIGLFFLNGVAALAENGAGADATTDDSILSLQDKWPGQGQTLNKDAFEKALYWIVKDPQGRKLVADAMKRGRVKKADDLLRYVSLDVSAASFAVPKGSSLHGDITYNFSTSILTSNISDIAQAFPKSADSDDIDLTPSDRDAFFSPLLANAKAQLSAGDGAIQDFFYAYANPDAAMVVGMGISKMALRSGTNLLDAVLTLTHELVHFAYMNEAERFVAIADAPTKDEAAYGFVATTGSEVDAVLMEYGLRARLYGGKRAIDERVRDLFDEQGDLTGDRREFAAFVLDGIGYRKIFEQEYAQDLSDARKKETRFVEGLGELSDSRELLKQQYERRVALYQGIDRDLDPDEKASLEDSQQHVRWCEASLKRIEKTKAQYQERIKSYEDKLSEQKAGN